MYASVETFAAEYAPYHTMPAFWRGVRDYQFGAVCSTDLGVHAQAYDRGAECAMRVERAKQNAGLN